MTRNAYLELTYRRGKLLAGYLYLPRKDDDEVVRSHKAADGLVVDYSADDRPIGIEIVSPAIVSVDMICQLLKDLHCKDVSRAELAPLQAG